MRVTAEVYFAIVPEWVLYSDVSDRAVRLYAVLARYANAENIAWPSRNTLTERLRCSQSSVIRAIRELEAAGALTVEYRFDPDSGDQETNAYYLHVTQGGVTADTPG